MKKMFIKLHKSEGISHINDYPILTIHVEISTDKSFVLEVRQSLITKETVMFQNNEYHIFDKYLRDYSQMNYELYEQNKEKIYKSIEKIIDRILTVSLFVKEPIEI